MASSKNNPDNPGNPVTPVIPAIDPKDFVDKTFCDERSENLEGRVERLGGYMKESKEEIIAAIKKNNN